MRFATLAANDVRLQFRHGFYAVYLGLAVLYVVLLRALPEAWRELALPVVIFSDPAVAGFSFLGAIFLLEKDDRSLQAVFVTPVREWEYLAAKVASLTLLSLLTSVIIAWGAVGFTFNVALFGAGVVLTAVFFTLVGMALVLRFSAFNRFFLVAGSGLAVLFAPVLPYFGIYDAPWMRAFPTDGSIALLGAAFAGGGGAAHLTPGQLAVATAVLVAWSVAAWFWARQRLGRYVVAKMGAET